MLHMISRGDNEVWHINCTRVQPKNGVLHYRTALENELHLREQIDAAGQTHEAAYPWLRELPFSARPSLRWVCGARAPSAACTISHSTTSSTSAVLPDEIGRYGYMDLPNPKYHCKNGGSYGMPYRSIIPHDGRQSAGGRAHDHLEYPGAHVDAQRGLLHDPGRSGGDGGGIVRTPGRAPA